MADGQNLPLHIPAGTLSKPLVALANASGVHLCSTDLPHALLANGLHGDYTIEAALDALLAGTGLTYRHSAPNTVTIEKAALAPHTFSTVRVHAQQTVPIVGANGSRDRYATENSGSYAARGASVGSVAPQEDRTSTRLNSSP